MGQLKIISGGQTGVDRAALDVAVKLNISYGGWCPAGRLAEDGVIPEQYLLQQTKSSDYKERTLLNICDSDGTLVIVPDEVTQITDGTVLTIATVKEQNKPYFILDLSKETDLSDVIDWIKVEKIKVLNIAGPRESQACGIYEPSLVIIECIMKMLEIKKEIEAACDVMKNLQNKFNEYYNFKDVAYFNRNKHLRKEVEVLKENVILLDCYKDDTHFDEHLKKHYSQTLFELSMVNFLRQIGFKVLAKNDRPRFSEEIKKGEEPSSPDILFSNDGNIYFLECGTRNFSQIDRYFSILPNFKYFLDIAKIYHAKYLELNALLACKLGGGWLNYIGNRLHSELNESQKNEVYCLLNKIEKDISLRDPKLISEKIEKWAYINQYMYFFHRDFMSEKIMSALKSVDILLSDGNAMISMGTDECHYASSQIANGIAIKIIEKLKKDYFNNGHFESKVMGSIAVGLSVVRDKLISPAGIKDYDILKEFNRLFQKECRADQEKITCSLNNLHCIIICTSWYNWFAEYAKNHHGASFPEGFNNAYMVLYLDDMKHIQSHLFKNHISEKFTYYVARNLWGAV